MSSMLLKTEYSGMLVTRYVELDHLMFIVIRHSPTVVSAPRCLYLINKIESNTLMQTTSQLVKSDFRFTPDKTSIR